MKKNKAYIWVLSIFLLVIVSDMVSCSRDFIPGIYVSNYEKGADTLILFSNHKFKRICYPNTPENKTCFIDTGSWNSQGIRSREIVFRYWQDRNGMNHSGLDREFIFIADIDRTFFIGRLRLLIDDDMGYYYIKK